MPVAPWPTLRKLLPLLLVGLGCYAGAKIGTLMRFLPMATTGFGQLADRERTARAGFDHHLTKPTDPALVRQLLREHVG